MFTPFNASVFQVQVSPYLEFTRLFFIRWQIETKYFFWKSKFVLDGNRILLGMQFVNAMKFEITRINLIVFFEFSMLKY